MENPPFLLIYDLSSRVCFRPPPAAADTLTAPWWLVPVEVTNPEFPRIFFILIHVCVDTVSVFVLVRRWICNVVLLISHAVTQRVQILFGCFLTFC